jgi:hypothetical protein
MRYPNATRVSTAQARRLALMIGLGALGCGGASQSDLLSDAAGGRDAQADQSVDAPQEPDQGPAPDTAPPKDVVTIMESSPPIDTGPPDTGPKLPPIDCGGATCAIPASDCCFTPGEDAGDGTYACQTPANVAACSGAGNTPIECAVGADCPGGVCCGTRNFDDTGYQMVECATSCSPDDNQILFCDPGSSTDVANCTALGGTCVNSELLPGFTVCQVE